MPEFLCPKCDHPLTLNPEPGTFRCKNCGFRRPETLDEAAARIRAQREANAQPDVRITHRGALDYRARALFEDGQASLRQGDTAAALDAFRDALDLQPDFTDAHLWIAKLSDDEAIQRDHLGEIIARDPGNLEALRRADGAQQGDHAGRSRTQPRRPAHPGDPPNRRRGRGADDRTALPGLRRHADHRRSKRAGRLPVLRAHRAARRASRQRRRRKFSASRCSSAGFSRSSGSSASGFSTAINAARSTRSRRGGWRRAARSAARSR